MAAKRPKQPSPKQGAKLMEMAQRRAEAVKLRRQGKSYRAIAQELGVTEGTAFSDVQAVLAETLKIATEDAEQARQLELERIDTVIEAMTPAAEMGDARSAELLLKASESRRKLLGLDAANRVEHSGPEGAPIEIDSRDSLLERLASLVAGAASDGGPSQDPGATQS